MNDIRTYEQAIARLRKVLAHWGANQVYQQVIESRSPDRVVYRLAHKPGANQVYQQVIESRDEVMRRFQPIFSIEHLPELSQEEFHAFLLLKNNQHWSGLQRLSPKMCADMSLLRSALTTLTDETQPIESRLDQAVTTVHGMGKAVATAILLIAYPEKYGVWNSTSKGGLKALNLWPRFERGESLGSRYAKINQILNQLANDLQIDLWTLDGLWWGLEVSPDVPTGAPPSDESLRADLGRPVEFTIAGHRFSMSGHQVLEQARQVLVGGIPPEARRYKEWVADVDGQPVGVKWLISLATGVDVGQFVSSHARSILRRMGIEARSLKQATSLVVPKVPARRRGARRKKPPDDAKRRYGLLDAEVRVIRDFLDGVASTRPTDECLCYWVYLCLTFELHEEGWQLFTLIDPSQIQNALYEHTKRFAEICRIRAGVQM